jgi:hypothetical protein
VTGPESSAIVAVEILMEEDVIAEMRIGLEFFRAAEDRPPPLRIAQEKP